MKTMTMTTMVRITYLTACLDNTVSPPGRPSQWAFPISLWHQKTNCQGRYADRLDHPQECRRSPTGGYF